MDAPAGATFAKWASKVTPDGRLVFAPSAWRAQDGREIPAPPSILAVHSSTAGDDVKAGLKPEETQTDTRGAAPSP